MTKSNIVDIACKKAKEEDQQRNVDLDKVIKSKEFAQKCNYEFEKSEKGGFPNIGGMFLRKIWRKILY